MLAASFHLLGCLCCRQNEEEANQNPELAVQTTDTVLESLGDFLRGSTDRWHPLKSDGIPSPLSFEYYANRSSKDFTQTRTKVDRFLDMQFSLQCGP